MSEPADAAAEVVDVIDEHGVVVRHATRAEVRSSHLRHRTVFVVVLSSDGRRLLAHQRADWKDVWPSRFDLAFGGVLAAGETFADGARRELAEEAGLTGATLARLGEGRFDDGRVREHAEGFVTRSDGPFTFVDGEVVATEWVALDDLDRWIATHDVVPDSVAIVRPLLGPLLGF
jgi:8-oxo-dGTP pyrophosphatase MutT (NUDIX family)